ncbi:MAG TPA: energy-coupling factor transporter transmembrane component T [Baekduia sp.]|uniref:energy-coupling factor transporter transmembrane component T family protein n=1 Tax=Baekduia sp. TaxID=2600305 RepID=UPI002C36C010|nr:energy-coupling factor transporter transmembrane component T [Baekduia sp.]HMJ33431.1 energy-coupling factor transporter transmembrane component T [Baekduia sp.]
MSGHGPELVSEVRTALHDAAPEAKVVAVLVFALSVAFVPAGTWWPFAVDLVVVLALAVWGRVPPRGLALRLVVEVPFIAFVVVLPLVAGHEGLLLAGAIAAKATLVVLATGVLSATTPAPAIVAGLERLRVPPTFTAIGALAVRYLQVVLDELRRVNTARIARGHDARWIWQARAVAQSSGTLAVRCLNRGERVHGAMLARGWNGRMPNVGDGGPAAAGGATPAITVAFALPALAATLAARGGAW